MTRVVLMTADKKERSISKDVFVNLFFNGISSKEECEPYVKRFFEDEEITSLLKDKKETDRLRMFKVFIQNMMIGIEDSIQAHIELLKKDEERAKDNFIDSIPTHARISKNEITRMIKLHKTTLTKYNKNFNDFGRQGVELKSFLAWLKYYSPNQYEVFKQAYSEIKTEKR